LSNRKDVVVAVDGLLKDVDAADEGLLAGTTCFLIGTYTGNEIMFNTL
jgi:hypothetical protein